MGVRKSEESQRTPGFWDGSCVWQRRQFQREEGTLSRGESGLSTQKVRKPKGKNGSGRDRTRNDCDIPVLLEEGKEGEEAGSPGGLRGNLGNRASWRSWWSAASDVLHGWAR